MSDVNSFVPLYVRVHECIDRYMWFFKKDAQSITKRSAIETMVDNACGNPQDANLKRLAKAINKFKKIHDSLEYCGFCEEKLSR